MDHSRSNDAPERPRHIVAELVGPLPEWRPDSPGFQRLIDAAMADGREALAALFALAARGASPAPAPVAAAPAAPPRRSSGLVDEFDKASRDAEREWLLDRVQDADAERRRLLIAQAEALHSPCEHRILRRRALRALHGQAFAAMTERAASRAIRADLVRRGGNPALSTGSRAKDRICDAIIFSGGIPSDRTIRTDIAPN
ncbi:MAG: hypothetical protein K2Z25_15385 [Beijerinckiaceae bacterium]|nr:hypothetical protein [Beijerinckiaceae bacterium]